MLLIIVVFRSFSYLTTGCSKITDDLHIITELREFPNWRQLGEELSIPSNTLKVIDKDERDTADKTREVLHKWYNRNEVVCWEHLTAALRAIGEANLAKKIADNHCKT